LRTVEPLAEAPRPHSTLPNPCGLPRNRPPAWWVERRNGYNTIHDRQ
jgi:hypothetical protein